jgi:hypothetical protein
MKRKNLFQLTLILGLLLCWGKTFGQDYYEIDLEFHHSRKIQNNHVSIDIIKRIDTISVKVTTGPPIKDTSFTISKSEFVKIVNSLALIKSSDIISTIVFFALDGTTCSIKFGDFNNTITYTAWSPDYNTKERKLVDFLEAFKLVLSVAKLDPSKIL